MPICMERKVIDCCMRPTICELRGLKEGAVTARKIREGVTTDDPLAATLVSRSGQAPLLAD